MLVVLEYLVLEIPSENEINIWNLIYLRFNVDRQMHPRGIQPTAQGVLFKEALDQIGTYPEVIEQRVPLTGAPIPKTRRPFFFASFRKARLRSFIASIL